MKEPSRQSQPSQQIARRMLSLEGGAGTRSESETIAALQRTCARVTENLSSSLGDDGCAALLARAVARTESDHPALKNIRGLNGRSIYMDGVVASVEAHGVATTTTAIEALLAALVDILGRLIGEDMAIRLMDDEGPRSRNGDSSQAP